MLYESFTKYDEHRIIKLSYLDTVYLMTWPLQFLYYYSNRRGGILPILLLWRHIHNYNNFHNNGVALKQIRVSAV